MRYLIVNFDEKDQNNENGSFNTMMSRKNESNARKVKMIVGCTWKTL